MASAAYPPPPPEEIFRGTLDAPPPPSVQPIGPAPALLPNDVHGVGAADASQIQHHQHPANHPAVYWWNASQLQNESVTQDRAHGPWDPADESAGGEHNSIWSARRFNETWLEHTDKLPGPLRGCQKKVAEAIVKGNDTAMERSKQCMPQACPKLYKDLRDRVMLSELARRRREEAGGALLKWTLSVWALNRKYLCFDNWRLNAGLHDMWIKRDMKLMEKVNGREVENEHYRQALQRSRDWRPATDTDYNDPTWFEMLHAREGAPWGKQEKLKKVKWEYPCPHVTWLCASFAFGLVLFFASLGVFPESCGGFPGHIGDGWPHFTQGCPTWSLCVAPFFTACAGLASIFACCFGLCNIRWKKKICSRRIWKSPKERFGLKRGRVLSAVFHLIALVLAVLGAYGLNCAEPYDVEGQGAEEGPTRDLASVSALYCCFLFITVLIEVNARLFCASAECREACACYYEWCMCDSCSWCKSLFCDKKCCWACPCHKVDKERQYRNVGGMITQTRQPNIVDDIRAGGLCGWRRVRKQRLELWKRAKAQRAAQLKELKELGYISKEHGKPSKQPMWREEVLGISQDVALPDGMVMRKEYKMWQESAGAGKLHPHDEGREKEIRKWYRKQEEQRIRDHLKFKFSLETVPDRLVTEYLDNPYMHVQHKGLENARDDYEENPRTSESSYVPWARDGPSGDGPWARDWAMFGRDVEQPPSLVEADGNAGVQVLASTSKHRKHLDPGRYDHEFEKESRELEEKAKQESSSWYDSYLVQLGFKVNDIKIVDGNEMELEAQMNQERMADTDHRQAVGQAYSRKLSKAKARTFGGSLLYGWAHTLNTVGLGDGLDPAMKEEANEIFDRIDSNGDGELQREEIISALDTGFGVGYEDSMRLISLMDADHDGTISRGEFQKAFSEWDFMRRHRRARNSEGASIRGPQATAPPKSEDIPKRTNSTGTGATWRGGDPRSMGAGEGESDTRALAQDIFRVVDKDGNGYLDVKEVEEALKELNIAPPEAIKLVYLMDSDRNGVVTEDEFVQHYSEWKFLLERGRTRTPPPAPPPNQNIPLGIPAAPAHFSYQQQGHPYQQQGHPYQQQGHPYQQQGHPPPAGHPVPDARALQQIEAVSNSYGQMDVEHVFNLIDADRNGQLSKAEIETALRTNKAFERMNPADAARLLQRVDADGDGMISKAEFKKGWALWRDYQIRGRLRQ